jgi:ABC-2 type transport system ATP-binding protein
VAAIATEGLTKFYGAHRGIEELTMTVEEGEVFGFLGPNGAGKTTTIRTLLDLLHPDAGRAQIFGLDSRRDSVAIRARLGNLPGDFGFGSHTRGRDALALLARLRGVAGLDRATELAERLRADLTRPLGQLSRGNRQKVGLILALFHRPELLIFDEPTGGLDPLMQEEFLALVAEERERGATVFLSSHELDEVQRVCDRVGIIRAGRLIAVERVAELVGRTRRRVSVEFAAPVDLGELRASPGVGDVRGDGRRVTFTLAGDVDAALKAISRHTVVDLELAHPTLEEVFLTYYEERGADRGGAPASSESSTWDGERRGPRQ